MARRGGAGAGGAPARAAVRAVLTAILARNAAAWDCWEHTQSACLSKPGCRWFSYVVGGGCDLCDAWFGSQQSVTGCRSWDEATYCQDVLYNHAKGQYHGDPHDLAFREALTHYEITKGTGDPDNPFQKVHRCSVFCDLVPGRPCVGQARAGDEFKGVNYGGRFVPERYLGLDGYKELYAGVPHPLSAAGKKVSTTSLCDVAAKPDAAKRVADFLDTSIKQEHFTQIAAQGFNVVRLPVGYWNFIQPPGKVGPNAPGGQGIRWVRLQHIMKPSEYRKWIDRVFDYAGNVGLKVLLDLHAAPGGQEGNAFTGCDMGLGNRFFATDWNRHLAVHAIGEMARVCGAHLDTCYGIELLNEPSFDMSRDFLKDFYLSAIWAARKHLPKTTPIIVMDWTVHLNWWYHLRPFNYKEHGRILFSTHLYEGKPETNQELSRKKFNHDLNVIRNFATGRYEIMVTEWALQGHGNAHPGEDPFDYDGLAHFLVHQFNQHGTGSAVWNFDAFARCWGPVGNVNLGPRPVDWKHILQTPRSRIRTEMVFLA